MANNNNTQSARARAPGARRPRASHPGSLGPPPSPGAQCLPSSRPQAPGESLAHGRRGAGIRPPKTPAGSVHLPPSRPLGVALVPTCPRRSARAAEPNQNQVPAVLCPVKVSAACVGLQKVKPYKLVIMVPAAHGGCLPSPELLMAEPCIFIACWVTAGIPGWDRHLVSSTLHQSLGSWQKAALQRHLRPECWALGGPSLRGPGSWLGWPRTNRGRASRLRLPGED